MSLKDKQKRNEYQKKWASENRDRTRIARKKWEKGKGKNYRRKLKSSRPENTRKTFLKSVYGITPQIYDDMLRQQDGKCLICDTHHAEVSRRLFIDHDHVTNKIRGLLCHGCNSGLGYFKDSVNNLKKAIEYLREKNVKPLNIKR